MRQITRILVFGLVVLGLASCAKEDNNTGHVMTIGAYVLNEGDFTANNAAISALDITSGDIDNHWFENANGYGLGKQAQDMVLYNSKLYVTVTESNTLEAIDPATGRSTQKSMGTLKPRSIAAEDGKLYITCYTPTCVVRVDATTLAIEDTCMLNGYKPEGIAIANGKAFVAGAYNDSYQYDNRLYVVDLATFDTLPSITVGSNLNKVMKINDSKLIVSWGNGSDSPNGCAIVDVNSGAVTPVNHGLTKMDVYNGKVYGYDAIYNGPVSWVIISADGSVADFPFTPAIEGNAYGININPANGDLYILDADYQATGDVLCYRQDGTLRFKSETAKFPTKVVFL